MIQCSDAFKNAFNTFGRQLTITITAGNLELTGDDIVSIRPHFEGQLLSSVMRCMDVEIFGFSALESDSIQIQLSVGSESLSFGTYYIKSQEYDDGSSILTLECYDAMLLSMVPYDLEVTYPVTVKAYLDAICTRLGYTAGYGTTITNGAKNIGQDLYKDLGCSYRDVLTEIAQVTGSTIILDGLTLKLVQPTASGYTITPENLHSITIGDKFGPVNSVVLSRAPQEDNVYRQDAESIAANGLTEIRIENNQIMDGDRESFLPGLLTALDGLTFYTYEIQHYGLPWLDVCDLFTLTDLSGNTYTVLAINSDSEIGKGGSGSLSAEIPDTAKTDYTAAATTERTLRQTALRVNKQEQKIEAIIVATDDNDGNIQTLSSSILQLQDSIDASVKETKDSMDGIQSSVSAVSQKVDGLDVSVQKATTTGEKTKTDLDAHFTFTDSGVTIYGTKGSSNSDRVEISANQQRFMHGDEEVLTLKESGVEANNILARGDVSAKTMTIAPWQFFVDANGVLTLGRNT